MKGAVTGSLCLALLLTLPAFAQTLPDYSDDRSSAADVVLSLYNAINRREYLRAYSYYQDGTLGFYSRFAAGYADTDHVQVRLGEVTGDAGAGTAHFAVPVALRATDVAGRVQVFVGCYHVSQLQPAVQDTPPFQPIQIDKGHLTETADAFDTAMGRCD